MPQVLYILWLWLLSDSGDESTHQILSYDLLFLTFYHFPYTTDPPTCTTPTWPSTIFVWTFTQSPLTIPYTHCTIGLAPCWRPPIWPTDHIVPFSFLSLFSITQCVLSWPNWSQVITLCDWDFTIHFAAHKPCACFTYHLYLRLLYLLRKTRKFFPRTQTQDHFALLFCLALSHTFTHLCTSDPLCTIALLWTLTLQYFALLDTTSGDHSTAPELHPSEPHRIYT